MVQWDQWALKKLFKLPAISPDFFKAITPTVERGVTMLVARGCGLQSGNFRVLFGVTSPLIFWWRYENFWPSLNKHSFWKNYEDLDFETAGRDSQGICPHETTIIMNSTLGVFFAFLSQYWNVNFKKIATFSQSVSPLYIHVSTCDPGWEKVGYLTISKKKMRYLHL